VLWQIQPSPAQAAKGGSYRVLLAEHTLNDQLRRRQLIFSQLLANEIPFPFKKVRLRWLSNACLPTLHACVLDRLLANASVGPNDSIRQMISWVWCLVHQGTQHEARLTLVNVLLHADIRYGGLARQEDDD
jgi:hypothetical protein